MNLDLGPVVQSFAGTTVTHRRQATAGFDASGYPNNFTNTDTSIRVVMQRPSPDALQRLPEGERAAVRWLIHVPESVDIRGAGQSGDDALADLILYGGELFTVIDIEDQTEHGGFRRCLLKHGGG